MKSLSCVQLFATPWTVAYQSPPFMEYSRQEYWNGLPFNPELNDSSASSHSHYEDFALWAFPEPSPNALLFPTRPKVGPPSFPSFLPSFLPSLHPTFPPSLPLLISFLLSLLPSLFPHCLSAPSLVLWRIEGRLFGCQVANFGLRGTVALVMLMDKASQWEWPLQ